MTAGTVIVLALIGVAAFFAVRSICRDRKEGKLSCGSECTGNCGSCPYHRAPEGGDRTARGESAAGGDRVAGEERTARGDCTTGGEGDHGKDQRLV